MYIVLLKKTIVNNMVVELKILNQLYLKTLDHNLIQTVIFYMSKFWKQNSQFYIQSFCYTDLTFILRVILICCDGFHTIKSEVEENYYKLDTGTQQIIAK